MSARPEAFRPHSDLEALRLPPQSVEAEQAVIGGLMLAPEAVDQVADLLTEADFYRRDHRLIYRGILELAEKSKPFDAVTLGEWFEANGLSAQIGGPSYLIELASTTPSAANIRAYAEIVRDKGVLRELIEAGTDIVNDGFQPEGLSGLELAAKAQSRLSNLGEDRARGGFKAPKPALKKLFHNLQDRWNATGELTGLSTPLRNWDEITLGLQPADLIILAARPSMGKSVVAFDVAAWVAEHHGDTALFSLEMSEEQFWQRQTASRGRIPHDWLRSPQAYQNRHDCDPEEYWAKVHAAMKAQANLPLHIDDTGRLTIDQICTRTLRKHRALKREGKKGLLLIVIDHVHIVALPGKNQVSELGNVSSKLKALGKETGASVLALAQLNRANKDRTDKRPTMSDLRASGEIEQDADEIWFLHREDYYDRKTHLKGVVELINGKSRNAPMGETAFLRNRFDQMRAEDWEGPLPEKEDREPAPRKRGFKAGAAGKEAAAGADA